MSKDTSNDDESGAGCNVCKLTMDADGLLGWNRYPYGYLCMPSLPWSKGGVAPPAFFRKDEKLPLLLSLFLGLQHCIAMLAGIATSGGYLITNDACLDWQKDTEMCALMPWMISVAFLVSGLLTIIQVFRLSLGSSGYFIGTGLISVMGTSFTFLPTVRNMVLQEITDAQNDWAICNSTIDAGGNTVWDYTGDCCSTFGFGGGNKDCRGAGAIGYGKFLGTCMVAAFMEVFLSLIPPRIMRKLFPPVVTGSAIMLIGGGLISSGMQYVGGGVFCAENAESRAAAGVAHSSASDGGSTMFGNRFLRDQTETFGTIGPQMCENDNGEVVLTYGSPEYVGLAFSVICFSVVCQLFGSPFIKSTYLVWGLCFGCAVAACGKEMPDYTTGSIDADGNRYGMDTEWKSYFRKDYLYGSESRGTDAAPWFTFAWEKKTFPIAFSPENFLPILIGFVISSAETVGDVAMSAKFSKITDEDDIASRVQGGLLADGINSFLAVCMGSPPNTTFSQNNGLISLTRCASRSAGFSCAFWLILFGIIGKFGGLFASIPICVMGGVVLQLWSSVFVSGMVQATTGFTRRNGFILTIALGIGMGVAMEGQMFDYPGPYSFFRKVLVFDYGFWPMSMVCKTPNLAGNTNGVFCQAYNGPCCLEWNDGAKMWRSAIMAVLKTPYGIGFVLAFVLNLILPEDKVDDDTEEFQRGDKDVLAVPTMVTTTSSASTAESRT